MSWFVSAAVGTRWTTIWPDTIRADVAPLRLLRVSQRQLQPLQHRHRHESRTRRWLNIVLQPSPESISSSSSVSSLLRPSLDSWNSLLKLVTVVQVRL
jgi:hypothetical protein